MAIRCTKARRHPLTLVKLDFCPNPGVVKVTWFLVVPLTRRVSEVAHREFLCEEHFNELGKLEARGRIVVE